MPAVRLVPVGTMRLSFVFVGVRDGRVAALVDGDKK